MVRPANIPANWVRKRRELPEILQDIKNKRPINAWEVAKVLNAIGYPTMTGKPWSRQAVEFIEKRAMEKIKQQLKERDAYAPDQRPVL
jgi:hypothetical protein